MTKPVLAVDIDEVLMPLADQFADFHNRRYGTDLTLQSFKSYEFKHALNMDVPSTIQRVQEFYASPDFRRINPFKPTFKALDSLSAHYRPIVITSRHRISREHTLEWLAKHFQELFEAVHFARLWQADPADNISKADICRLQDVEVLIDDNLDFCGEAAELGVSALLFGDYPWNQADGLPSGVKRVKDWDAVLAELLP